MKKTFIAAAAISVIGLTGCASLQPAPAPLAMQFNYSTSASAGTGLVRAFDMDGNTVLQFVDLAKAKPTIYGTDTAEPLAYQVVGQYAVLRGTHAALKVRTAGGTASVTRAGQAPTSAPLAAIPATVPAGVTPNELASARAALAKTQDELADVKRQLAALQANPNTSAPAVRAAAAKIDGIEQRLAATRNAIFRVNFDYASTSFAPAPDASATLLAGAKMATRINVRGHTDSPKADQVNYSIALGRAIATRQYLVKNGIDAKKIKLFAYPAGRFVAENKTTDGRRQNRRVEIELLGSGAGSIAARSE